MIDRDEVDIPAVASALGLRSDQATLDLVVVGFSVGALAFFFFITLNVLGTYPRPARLLARIGGYLVIAYVQGIVLLVAFLLLGVLGLA